MKGAEPFELRGHEAGVLLLHGFSGSTSEVRGLADLLHDAGFGVYAPALAGHGTDPLDLDAVSADDFFARAEEAYQEAAARYQRLYLVGFSLGGTLALHLAARHHVAGIVTIATPVFMATALHRGIPFAHRWSPWRNVISNYAAWRGEVVGYRLTPLSSLVVFLDVIERVRQDLGWIRAPLLVLHSQRDETVPVANATYISAHVASSTKRVRIFARGRHLMTVPPELLLIKADVVRFLHDLERKAGAADKAPA